MVFEKIRDILYNQLELDSDAVIEYGTDVIKDLGADSLDLAELLVDIEDEFDVVVNDEDIEGITTVGGFAEYIESLMK